MNTSNPTLPLTVLVVEDEETLRDSVIRTLQRLGLQTLEACDGQKALDVIRDRKVDLIVSDVRMPQKSGIDLLKEVRQLNPSIPIVILMTGYSEVSKEEAKKFGAYTLIDKPFSRQALKKQIFEALNLPAA